MWTTVCLCATTAASLLRFEISLVVPTQTLSNVSRTGSTVLVRYVKVTCDKLQPSHHNGWHKTNAPKRVSTLCGCTGYNVSNDRLTFIENSHELCTTGIRKEGGSIRLTNNPNLNFCLPQKVSVWEGKQLKTGHYWRYTLYCSSTDFCQFKHSPSRAPIGAYRFLRSVRGRREGVRDVRECGAGSSAQTAGFSLLEALPWVPPLSSSFCGASG